MITIRNHPRGSAIDVSALSAAMYQAKGLTNPDDQHELAFRLYHELAYTSGYVLAENGNHIVGWIRWQFKEIPNAIHFDWLYVDPSYRDAGIPQMLIPEAERISLATFAAKHPWHYTLHLPTAAEATTIDWCCHHDYAALNFLGLDSKNPQTEITMLLKPIALSPVPS